MEEIKLSEEMKKIIKLEEAGNVEYIHKKRKLKYWLPKIEQLETENGKLKNDYKQLQNRNRFLMQLLERANKYNINKLGDILSKIKD